MPVEMQTITSIILRSDQSTDFTHFFHNHTSDTPVLVDYGKATLCNPTSGLPTQNTQ